MKKINKLKKNLVIFCLKLWSCVDEWLFYLSTLYQFCTVVCRINPIRWDFVKIRMICFATHLWLYHGSATHVSFKIKWIWIYLSCNIKTQLLIYICNVQLYIKNRIYIKRDGQVHWNLAQEFLINKRKIYGTKTRV